MTVTPASVKLDEFLFRQHLVLFFWLLHLSALANRFLLHKFSVHFSAHSKNRTRDSFSEAGDECHATS